MAERLKELLFIIFLLLGFLGFLFSFGEDINLQAGANIILSPSVIIREGIIALEESITLSGNVTAENVFLPQYIFAHDNMTVLVLAANEWTNVSFSQEEIELKLGILHNHTDTTNTTFTINVSGIYYLSFNMDLIDISPSASDIDVAGRFIYVNGSEIIGSIFETDITKQQVETELSHELLARLHAGDQILLQFTANDGDVEISTHGTFGEHPDSVTMIIEKISNIP